MKLVLATAATFIIAGCASAPTEQADAGNRVVCSREVGTGTLLATNRCRTQQEIDADRASAKDRMDQVRQSGMPEHMRPDRSGGTAPR